MNKLILSMLLAIAVFAKDVKIYIESMHCPLCTSMVRKSILNIAGVKSAKVLLKTKMADIVADDSISDEILLKAISDIGYPGVIIKEQ